MMYFIKSCKLRSLIGMSICFTNLENPSCFALSNSTYSFQKTLVIETSLSNSRKYDCCSYERIF